VQHLAAARVDLHHDAAEGLGRIADHDHPEGAVAVGGVDVGVTDLARVRVHLERTSSAVGDEIDAREARGSGSHGMPSTAVNTPPRPPGIWPTQWLVGGGIDAFRAGPDVIRCNDRRHTAVVSGDRGDDLVGLRIDPRLRVRVADLLARVGRAGWSGASPAVGLSDEYARIVRDRCAAQLRGLLSGCRRAERVRPSRS
jgi:hypothetical protein